MKSACFTGLVCVIALVGSNLFAQNGQWKQQPVSTGTPGLWALSMKDTGAGIAAGMVNLGNGHTGVLRKTTGNPLWETVPAGSFTPAIPGTFNAWYDAAAFAGSPIAYICGNNSRVYKSTDNGLTWNQQTNGIGISKTLFGMHFKSSTEGMVVGDDGVAFYTTDGGANWSSLTTGTTQSLYAVHSAGSDWFVTGASNTMLKFTPPNTWTSLSVAPYNAFGQVLADVQFLNNSSGFTSGGNALLNGSVLYTSNGGSSWNTYNVPTSGTLLYKALRFFSSSEGWAANSFDALYYTSNSGANWTQHAAFPTIGLTGAVTKLDFPLHDIGYASGGAIGGTGPTSGWVIKWTETPLVPVIATNDTLKFGSITCDPYIDHIFKITNTGTAPLTIPASGFVFSYPFVTLVSPSLPQTIQPGDFIDFTIRWSPPPGFTDSIPSGSTLEIQSNDPVTPVKTVLLQGYRAYKFIKFASYAVAFPNACKGAVSTAISSATPVGADPQFIGFVHASGAGGVTVVNPPIGSTVGAQTDFEFRFQGTSQGPQSGSYYFISGDPSCPDTAIISFTASVDISAFDFPASPIDFGSNCAEKIKDIVVDLTNTGTIPTQIIKREFVSGKDVFPNPQPGFFGPVQPGASAQYIFRFLPGQFDTGSVSGTYRYILGPCQDTVLITFTGYSVKQSVKMIPTTTLVMGPTPIGGQNDAEVQIVNMTVVPVTLSRISLAPTYPNLTILSPPGMPLTLQPGDTITLTVRYKPQVIESLSADLCVVHTVPCTDSLCISVLATSSAPPNIVVRSPLQMDLQKCADPVRDTVTIYNTGPGLLTITKWLIGGPQAIRFSVASPAAPPLNIPSGDSAAMVVEFNSPDEGPAGGLLILEHNDPKQNYQTVVSLSASREVYEFEVEGDTITRMEACYGTTAQRRFVVRNTGAHTIQIINADIQQSGQAFDTGILVMPQVLAPGDSLPITVTMNATFAGFADAVLRIHSEPCSFERIIPLRGEGIRTFLVFTPPSIDFGSIPAGNSQTVPLDIRNTGSRTAVIDSIVLLPRSAEFSFDSPPAFPLSVAVNSGTLLMAKYTPVTEDGIDSRLCVYIGSPCPDTICIPVRGSSSTANLAVDKPEIELHLDPCSIGTTCEDVRITNFSPLQATITNVQFTQSFDHFSLQIAPNPPYIIPGNGVFDFRICAMGSFTGMDTATVVLTTDKGKTVAVRIRAYRDSVQLLLPARFNLGVMARCQTSMHADIPVTNTGTAADTLDVVNGLRAPFSLPGAFPLVVAPGAQSAFPVSFSPASYSLFEDTLTLRSRRCGTTYVIIVYAAYLERNIEVVPNPLTFGMIPAGSRKTLPLSVRNMNLRHVRVSNILFSTPEYTTTTAMPFNLDSGSAVSVPVQFSPPEKLAYNATICVLIDEPCLDTLCIDVSGAGVESDIEFAPAFIDFPATVQCESRVDTVVFRNRSLSPVIIDSAVVEGTAAGAFVILDPVAGKETIAPGGSRVFRIQFDPASLADGQAFATLAVYSNSAIQPKLEAPLTGIRITQSAPPQVNIDFATIQAGVPSSRTFTLSNPGTAPIQLTGAVLPAQVALVPPPPYSIPAGGSIDVQATLTPSQTGAIDIRFSLYASPCPDSTLIVLSGTANSDITLEVPPVPAIASCDTVTIRCVVRNPLPGAVELQSIALDGVDASYFTVLSPPTPATIPANDSLEILLTFSPDPGINRLYSAGITATVSRGAAGFTLHSAIAVSTYVPMLALAAPVTLPPSPVGDPPSVVWAVFVNTTPAPVTLYDVQFDDPQFDIQSIVPQLPATVLPGDSVRIMLSFTPAAEGEAIGHLSLLITEPCRTLFTHEFRTLGLPPSTMEVDLQIDNYSGRVDETVRIPVRTNTDLGSAGISQWSMQIEFNKWMLYPLRLVTEGTLSHIMQASMDYNFDEGVLQLSADGAPLIGGTGNLIAIEFLVLIGDQTVTPIAIGDTVRFNTPRRIALTRSDGLFTLTDYCFADGKRLISTAGRNYLYQPTPNPAQSTATIRYELADDGFVQIVVFNAIGEPVRRLVAEEKQKGIHLVDVDLQGLPSGTYIVMMLKGEFKQTRSLYFIR